MASIQEEVAAMLYLTVLVENSSQSCEFDRKLVEPALVQHAVELTFSEIAQSSLVGVLV